MSLMVAELYTALRAANVPEAEAQAAALAIADVRNVATKADLQTAIAELESNLKSTIISTMIAMTTTHSGIVVVALAVAAFWLKH